MKKRLLAVIVGLVVIVLFANDVPLSAKLSKIDRDRFVTAVQRDAFKIGGQVTPLMSPVGANQVREINAVLDDYLLRNNGAIVVIDDKGYLVASNDPTKSVGDDFTGRPEIRAALLGTPTSGTRSSVTLGGDLVYVAIPVLSGAHVLGVVRITYPKSLVDSRGNNHRRGLAGTAAISIALAVIVALLFARFVTQPLDNLRSTTEKFADGDLTAIAQESGPPETRDLASSFNLMAKRLGRMIDQQRSFAGDASHQMRSPLTALRLRLEQASDLVGSDPRATQNHLDEALSETERLSRLIEQLLQLARAEGVTLPLEDMDISEIISDRVEQWSSLAEERGVLLNANITTTVLVRGNAMALGEIIDNYLDNALEVSPVGSTVLVMAEVGDEKIELIVRDQGAGLSDEQRSRAFDRFWRGAEQSNRRSGSGLGLAIVSQLANASGYRVELRKSPQGGVDAVVGLPRATAANT